MSKIYTVKNMHCASCATLIESDLEDIGITAQCSYAKQRLEVEDDEKFSEEKIKEVVKKAGYELQSA